ncbi:MAG: 2-iminoacetate synthase ThiH [Spirochaetes bacterium]|jgi:2-iminoacetate synthase|nr:2-iminoacetate synthase ThiH [Spirochaetota bacterium]
MFESLLDKYPWEKAKERIYNSTERDFLSSIQKERHEPEDLFPFFSPAADFHLEQMARLSYKITRNRFGNIIQLYAPLYVSNECTNSCAYCGFNARNSIKRVTLTAESAEEESLILFKMGFRHILLVSGEHKGAVPAELLYEIGKRIHKKFASVSIEVYPMETEEYKKIIESGVDGLTLYQETYDRQIYNAVHLSGTKKNYSRRLAAPENGGDAGFRKIGIGALLGLSDWRVDGFFTALHAQYLMKKYWRSFIQVSFPRLRKASGGYVPPSPVDDTNMTHLICAMRIILPDAGLLLSTRENAVFRDNIMPVGITMMSAGSSTEPGGYSMPEHAGGQFEIEDRRPPEIIADIIRKKGLEPVWKDWDRGFST